VNTWREFGGLNAGYVLEQYERYRRDPAAVDPASRAVFDHWVPSLDGELRVTTPQEHVRGVAALAEAIRQYGHLEARFDPLGLPRPGDARLRLETYGLTEDHLRALPAALVDGPAAQHAANALDAIGRLRNTYSSSSGYEYHHVPSAEGEWLREAIETRRHRSSMEAEAARALLDRLTQIEAFERFLHRMFPGKTRFSIEGLDMLVPMLDEIIARAADDEIHSVLIGMAHRGRLNVLAHVLNKPYERIFAEFRDAVRGQAFREDLGLTGDVKYHKGARTTVAGDDAFPCTVTLAPNPSHLEAVDPVIEGMARAAGTRVDRPGAPRFDAKVTLPLLIHGDAAFPGQGVVAETLNLCQLPGYHTGGTVHIIANNQLGFTTNPEETRSTLYASDLAKGFEIPIVHVNADDPEACLEAGRLAFAYRAQFRRDVLIDLVGYRRLGHNEGDEPSFTQPRMYEAIAHHPTVRAQWAETLTQHSVVAGDLPERLVAQHMKRLHEAFDATPADAQAVDDLPEPPPRQAAKRMRTAVPIERLRELHEAWLRVPDGFGVHPKLVRAMERRRGALTDADAASIDWTTGEALAFASILAEGIAIRLTGQDVARGTFSQRHAVLHDVATGDTFTPLQALPGARAAFEVLNSSLSESAALGFEYGYNIQEPRRLVLWEAQYGDFINNAQTMIDEFITSARSKWGPTPSLVLLLPHGYEAQGPDHSSGRLERFLELSAATNIRVANCTTAAQYFHLLRRQALLLTIDPLPLVVMTPKSLLRHPLTVSSLRELAEGGWQPVLDDADARARTQRVRRVLVCSGKVWADLVTSEQRSGRPEIAVLRVEQMEPFPVEELQSILRAYAALDELMWVQEEPENMGGWGHARPYLEELAGGRWPVRYVGRARSASPAEGSASRHQAVQEAIVRDAFGGPLVEQRPDGVSAAERP
jgi:2-oxoglutarate dehydrogenase E1 component